ncbi:MAG: adaptor protein MecA [Bariatricus sp.]|nr:adaptor protein MecA [Bariatricus sp.]
MKIEKINDNQIRCTLTHADLAERELKLSELAYGTEKAKSLFRDMMQQAAYEFGFEADNIPLMIEAIPSSSGSIVLIITKVEDPEELDTRFSKFSPLPLGESSDKMKNSMLEHLKKLEGADDFLDLLRHVTDSISELPKEETKTEDTKAEEPKESSDKASTIRFFSFGTLDGAIQASHLLVEMYEGCSTLYKDENEDIYILALTQSEHTTADYNRICNMLSEYGSAEPGNGASLAFLEEHCEVIAAQNAVQLLGNL